MSLRTSITPVILSGGSGTRLWPMSRPERPKQMLALTAKETMLQLTAMRAKGERFSRPIVVANARHADMVSEQLDHIGTNAQAVIFEPIARSTAPAIALAALATKASSLLLVMPSDQIITDIAAFHAAIQAALRLVADGWLVTFGIAPDAAETGYGWIKVGEDIDKGVYRVAHLIEKPPRSEAEAMLAAGDYTWNSGIFLFRADTYLNAVSTHAPAMLTACQLAMTKAKQDGKCIFPDVEAFAASPDNSIDYAVLEKANRVAVVPVSMGWSDIGSWDALHAISDLDAAGNANSSGANGEIIAIETSNCLVRTDSVRVTIVGVDDLIVVASNNDLLILPRGRSQEVKKLIEAMKTSSRSPNSHAAQRYL